MSGDGRVRGVRASRITAGAVVPGELAWLVCLASGIRPPGWATATAGAVALTAFALQAWVLRSLYAHQRGRGLEPAAALRAAAHALVPVQMRQLLAHEVRATVSLGLWAVRRKHGVGPGDHAAGYTGPQTALLYGLLFVAVIETVALAYLIPWPVVHYVMLVLDVYGVLQVLGLHAACVTRPHVVHPDGSLRIRYGALFDLTVPAETIASARVDRRYPHGRLMTLSEEGVLDLIVAGQTTVTLELNRPLVFTRPLGRTGEARTIRFHADDPRALAETLRPPAPTRIPVREDG
ncbi:hypothetical protein [Streptomyces albipurpureus]|uniref:Integral membrane protein n=1 Tax=Streptomyces albipurpureus TaxID=2897419 RepID=A0ABT0UIV3_9ACTN|nr:hypothetical protein [Streptomyces sp. CWNU-1]MCM2388573.1 hypothetical protein [Streptomyces sp. CWNU-1]